MTREQARFALEQIANSDDGDLVTIYLNGSGLRFVGAAIYEPHAGLIIVDDNRAFIRPEQVAAISRWGGVALT